MLSIFSIAMLASCDSGKKGFSARPVDMGQTSLGDGSSQGTQPGMVNPAVPGHSSALSDYTDEDFLRDVMLAEEELKNGVPDSESAFQPPIEDTTVYEAPKIEIPEGDTLEIKEKMFLAQINDIYFNFDSYKDKTISLEGMFTELVSWDGKESYPAVYRRGPGCCGNDGWGGFMLHYSGAFPAVDEWIRVSGKPVLEKTEDGYENLWLDVISLEKKSPRGAEFVSQ